MKERKKLTGKKRKMYEALISELGVITTSARKANIARRTHYLWMDTDENYAAWCKELPDLVLDFAENALFRQIKNGNQAAISLFLKTKGKSRGYVERQEIITDVIMRKSATPEEVSIFDEFYDENGQRRNKEDSNKG